MGYPTFGPTLPYMFLSNRLLPLLVESPTNTLKEMSSCKLVISRVRHSMGPDFGKAGICVAYSLPYHTHSLFYHYSHPIYALIHILKIHPLIPLG